MNNFSVFEQVKLWLTSQIKHPCLIAIAGPTCAGKTYFSQKLQEYLLPMSSTVLCLDSYFKNILDPTLPHSPDQLFIFDEPGSFHEEEFRRDVRLLLSGEIIKTPVYDLPRNQRTNSTTILKSTSTIIAEGLYAINFLQNMSSPSLYIYVEADPDTCMKRRIERDLKIPNLKENDIRHHVQKNIIPRQKKYLEPQRHRADLIINST